MTEKKTAPCGLCCGECNLYLAGWDPEAARALVEWFRSRGWIGPDEGAEAVMKRAPLCTGCRATEGVRFCGECTLRTCCENRGLNDCGECADFPCKAYREWADGLPHHEKAMTFLMEKREISTTAASGEKRG